MWNWTRGICLLALVTGCSDGPEKRNNDPSNNEANNNVVVNNNTTQNAVSNNLAVSEIYRAGGTYTLGDEPRTPAVGDLNGDGNLDIVVVNQFSADTQFLYGDGRGGFDVDGESYSRAVAVVAADFDGNGLDDIAISVDEPRVAVVLNPGDLSFEISLEVSANPDGLATADFDGDGDTDLAVSIAGNLNEPGASVAVFPWGENTFEEQTLAAVGLQPRNLLVIDDDIVVLLGTKSALVLENNGSGTFAASAPFGVGDGVLEFALMDVDASGQLDLISADLSTNALTAALDVPGEDAVPLTDIAAPFGVTTLNANDDGVPDLAVTSIDDEAVIGLISKPGGTFSQTVLAELDGAVRLGGITAADLDGDGIDDLIVVERNRDMIGTLHIFLSSAE